MGSNAGEGEAGAYHRESAITHLSGQLVPWRQRGGGMRMSLTRRDGAELSHSETSVEREGRAALRRGELHSHRALLLVVLLELLLDRSRRHGPHTPHLVPRDQLYSTPLGSKRK